MTRTKVVSDKVTSPITGLDNIILEQSIKAKDIVDFYKNWPGIDVHKYFDNLDYVQLYKCQSTGYRFYYPFSLAGDEDFYHDLQVFPWYYVDKKWEHDVALTLIQSHDLVLEVGCGTGAFLRRLSLEIGAQALGLELNQNAVKTANAQGLQVYGELLDQHSEYNKAKYDVVCSFQVLEHVSNVKEFLDMKLSVLKPGGRLIIAVPNNNSFVKYAEGWATNMPPHHLGLWSKESLVDLQNFFPVKISNIYCEPLTNFEWYYDIQVGRLTHYIPFDRLKDVVQRNLKRKSVKSFSIKFLKGFKYFIPDHTILVEYVKLP
jgi:SAM-dependent methyltransferase